MKPADARVLLTGASGGIGGAAAAALVAAGAQVLAVGRSQERLAALAAGHAGIEPVRADLAVPADLKRLAAHAGRWRCNVLVHAAGVPAFGRLQTLPAERLEEMLQTNLLAPIRLTQALLPHLLREPQAQVICVGSALGRIGLPGYAAYSASKFGLRGFAEALRRELADTPVKVQYLGPRSTRTGFNDAGAEAYQRATGGATDSPERVAHALVALLRDGRPERFIGFPEALAVRLNGLAASWLDGAFVRHRRSLPL